MASRTGLIPATGATKDGRNKADVASSKPFRRSVVPGASQTHQARTKFQRPPSQARSQAATSGKDIKVAGAARNRFSVAQNTSSKDASHRVGGKALSRPSAYNGKALASKEVSKSSVSGERFDRRSTPGRFTGTKTKDQKCPVKQQPPCTPGRPVLTPAKKSSKKSILKKTIKSEDPEQKVSLCMEHTDGRHVTFKSKATQQASLRSKLNAWLEAKGKTPSRCRHLMCFDAEMSARKKEDRLVDRKITSNLLSGQAEVLEREVRKNLFNTAKTAASPVEAKPNLQKENLEPESLSDEKDTSDFAEAKETDTTMEEYEEIMLSQEKIDEIHGNLKTMLDECLTLFQGGCPLENILPWLEKMIQHIPQAQSFAPFYITKAKVVEAFPEQMLEVLCDAVRHNAQPADLLAAEMHNLLSPLVTKASSVLASPTRTSSYVPLMSPQPRFFNDTQSPYQQSPYQASPAGMMGGPAGCGEKEEESDAPLSSESTPAGRNEEAGSGVGECGGSTVKYSISSTTPLLSKTPDAALLAVVTPVRRSIRLSGRRSTPGIRREVNSVSDLSEAERSTMLFKVNPAVAGE
ncbi:uncharacterized protein LOC101857316 isoform X2 [Aplysia californica]|uniref:Uncharacterized protein LOC101857316 isoform X2 n=1 Tax=Aplysia californica TaxID=6500 RepID=A0ABM1VP75_APLCA|nr:uncharacterized protein LOC101857316 isoform X2 [Aplysia californica]